MNITVGEVALLILAVLLVFAAVGYCGDFGCP